MSDGVAPDPRPNWHDPSAHSQLVWHPAIRAAGWIIRWFVVAFCAAIVWEFLTLGTVNLFTSPALTLTLAALILVGLAMLLVLELLLELYWAMTRHARENYPAQFAARVSVVVAAISLVIAAPMLWFFQWALARTWQALHTWALRIPARPPWSSVSLSWGWILFLSAASIGLCWMLYRMLPVTARKYATAARCLGPRRMGRSILYMTLFRLRQPRRDFFVQAPIISDVPWWALCVVLHVGLAGTVFAWIVPLPLLLVSLEYSLSKVAPPVWLYLGASEADSFRVFYNLRRAWFWFHAVTLLDRESEQGQAAYFAEARQMQSRSLAGHVYQNPRAARIWSLRTRPDLWVQTVKALIDLVQVVVVDVRTGSDPVRYELGWLAQPGRVEKTWLIATDDRQVPALASANEWDEPVFPPERIVTEDMLYRATWVPGSGVRIDGAAQSR